MSWPHILSLSRVVASVPIAALIMTGGTGRLLAAALIFAVISLTDLLDGPLARRGRAVGPLGVYLDTTADKVLVSVVLIALASQQLVDVWMVMVIVGREFLVSGVRTLAAVQGFVVPANLAGKLKTTVTLAAMTLVMLVAAASAGDRACPLGMLCKASAIPAWQSVAWYLMLVATGLTVWSGTGYILDSRPLFFPERRAAAGPGEAKARLRRET